MHLPLPGTDLTDAQARHTAQQLHAYMTFRAGREDACRSTGISTACCWAASSFFGARIDTDRGGLLSDEQQPALFAEWRKH
jgi:hypothetical protein